MEVGLLLGCDEAGFLLLLDAAGCVVDFGAGFLVVGGGAGFPVFPRGCGFLAVDDEGFKLDTGCLEEMGQASRFRFPSGSWFGRAFHSFWRTGFPPSWT